MQKVWQLADPQYAHVGPQALITISTPVPSGMPNGPLVIEKRFGTGKQKSLISFDPTLQTLKKSNEEKAPQATLA